MKHSLLTSCLLLAAIVAQAAPVSETEARSNVLQFLNSKGRQKIKGVRSLTLAHTIYQRGEKQVGGSPMLYIYNVNGNQGFVVASADDVALPILAYGNEGGFSQDNIPDNVRAWLQGYADQIAAARANGASLQKVVRPSKAKRKGEGQTKPSAINVDARKDISPLLTTYWSQGYPFNLQCIFDGTECVTGCVATAMAQLLYYWATVGKDGKTFRGGCTSLMGYPNNDYDVPPLEAIYSFDWDNMRTRYWDSEEGEEGEEELAVAQLMRYCGQAVNMEYGACESGADETNVAEALFCNFHCFSNLQLIYNDDMSDEEWEGLIYNELENGRPVLMCGWGNGEGHEFLCDGYDSELNVFHFNWGWGGGLDGDYAMNALKLIEVEIGDKVFYLHDYSNHKSAIINVNPLASEPEATRYLLLSEDSTTMTLYYDSEYGVRKGHLLNRYEASHLGWRIRDNMTLRIDKSFAYYHPKDIDWFKYYVDVSNIVGLRFFNTDCLTSMKQMFEYCGATSLDLSSFDTSNVMDMEEMFSCCDNLQSLDISSFVFSEATNTKEMFSNCSSLISIIIPATAKYLADDAFTGVGKSEPCMISAPEDFDFGVDTSWDSFMWKGGRFTLYNPTYIMPGDVNHDGMVSVVDITMMVDYILTHTCMNDDFYFENADLNGDNKITIIDIEKVVSLILNPK